MSSYLGDHDFMYREDFFTQINFHQRTNRLIKKSVEVINLIFSFSYIYLVIFTESVSSFDGNSNKRRRRRRNKRGMGSRMNGVRTSGTETDTSVSNYRGSMSASGSRAGSVIRNVPADQTRQRQGSHEPSGSRGGGGDARVNNDRDDATQSQRSESTRANRAPPRGQQSQSSTSQFSNNRGQSPSKVRGSTPTDNNKVGGGGGGDAGVKSNERPSTASTAVNGGASDNAEPKRSFASIELQGSEGQAPPKQQREVRRYGNRPGKAGQSQGANKTSSTAETPASNNNNTANNHDANPSNNKQKQSLVNGE